MRCKAFTLAVFILFTIPLFSQSTDSLLQQYAGQNPQEKIYLHTDRSAYFAGETIWFKAYTVADGAPSIISTNLYADLTDAQGALLAHKAMPITGSTADGFFKLPDTTTASTYFIRAYTLWQLNFDTAFIYYKPIKISGQQTVPLSAPAAPAGLQFFAEGGNLIAGLYNYVAFKSTLQNGYPYEMKAAVKNSKGELIDSVETIHNGMGLFKFTPDAGETYTAEWKDNTGAYRKTPLPGATATGLLLHTEQVKDELYYLINSNEITEEIKEFTVMATINQKTVYSAVLKPKQLPLNQKINTSTFETGILQLTVLNKNQQPLAERIIFINNNNYKIPASVNIKESNTGQRGKNTIEIETKDTLSTNLSLAVYDAALEEEQAGDNIYSSLLLRADIKGYVHNAAWYFENNTPQAKEYLDLVMQTNGWRRYNWSNIITQTNPPKKYTDENYLSVYGKISGGNKQEGKAGETITLVLQTADSTKQWYMPISGKDGTFKQSGLIFYDTATVFYKPGNIKDKTLAIGMAKDYNGLTNIQPAQLPYWLQQAAVNTTNIAANKYTQIFLQEIKNKNPGFEQTAKVLNEVVVKSNERRNWKNDPLLKMDEKYAGIYRGIGANTWAFDVAHDSTAAAKFDIYNYMLGKIPGLVITYAGVGTKTLALRPSSVVAPPPVVIFVNESEVENDYLNNITLESIAYIKFYERIPWRQLFPPGIMIYLKKGDDLKEDAKKLPSNLSKLKVAGYSPVKEFYSPDYSMPDAKHSNADLRSTLLWQPYVLTNKEKPATTISFYNNDISKKLKIVLEGIDEDGRLIHIEKIIE